MFLNCKNYRFNEPFAFCQLRCQIRIKKWRLRFFFNLHRNGLIKHLQRISQFKNLNKQTTKTSGRGFLSLLVYALTEIALAAIVQFHPKNFDAKIAVEETKITHLLFLLK